MNPSERQEMLQRFDDADRWLTRIYDPNRTRIHRVSLWNFLMQHTNPKLKNLLLLTRQLDEDAVKYWDTIGRN